MTGVTIARAAVVLAALVAQESPFVGERKPDESDPFFERGEIPRLRIEIDEEELAKLRADARTYVHAKLKENERTVYPDVAIKLKGAAGSFRELDDKPAFTVNVDKFEKKQAFHGLEKFHLNNSVQDGTYCHEWLCSLLMAGAGIPAPRVTHARVWLNGRDLGLYVLKEAFDEELAKRHFKAGDGNLYDGGFCNEIDGGLEKDDGKGPDDGSDLRALADACREGDPVLRWQRIEERLDVDAFLSFVAMELMVGHWDGYSQNANNYRVYFAGKKGRAYFLPHGMDQVFGDAEAAILDYPTALVADAVLRNPAWRARFRKRISELLPLFAAKSLLSKLKPVQKRVEAAAKTVDGELAGSLDAAWGDLENRLVEREKSLRDQAKRPEPKTIELDAKGRAKVLGFKEHVEAGDVTIEPSTHAGRRAYAIECGAEPCVASWRRKVMLPRGRWIFEANVATNGCAAVDGGPGGGALLRISGADRGGGVVGDASWQAIRFGFEVAEETRLVELVAELHAAKGRCWFDVNGMRLTKLP